MQIAKKRSFLKSGDGYSVCSISNDGTIGNYYSYDNSSFSESCYGKSISFWAKMNASTGKGVFFKIGNTGYNGYGCGIATSSGGFANVGNYIRCLYEDVVWVGSYQITDLNAWHHYCIVTRGSSDYYNYIYKDGSLLTSFYSSSSIKTAGSGFAIAGYNDTQFSENRCLTGKMTRICYWNKQLNASEVAADYAKGINDPDLTNSSLQHYWKVDSNSGDQILDKVGSWHLTKHGSNISIVKESTWIA